MIRNLISTIAIAGLLLSACESKRDQKGRKGFTAQLIFPLQGEHVHGSSIVSLPSGDLLAAWFQGSGERWADDVRIMGSRLSRSDTAWSKPFIMADIDGFPDINPILFMDRSDRLWMMWYPVLANQWETSIPMYRI
ncbi:MAG TPA: exo-alpha-sialidase, partial [Chryseolinea sp.]|nr:exo-alpha-sialidase [Chryseolinea sp.]